MSKFEKVSEMLPIGYRLSRGVPDARFSCVYKYTIYYSTNFGFIKVCKTLKEVEDFCNNFLVDF